MDGIRTRGIFYSAAELLPSRLRLAHADDLPSKTTPDIISILLYLIETMMPN